MTLFDGMEAGMKTFFRCEWQKSGSRVEVLFHRTTAAECPQGWFESEHEARHHEGGRMFRLGVELCREADFLREDPRGR